MTHHPLITGCLLAIAVALAVVCSIGVLVMRDPQQRNQFSAPVVTLSMLLICIAVFIEESDSQARIKVILIAVLMAVMNSVLSHATARAIRIRQLGRWPLKPEENVPLVENKGIAGKSPHAEESP